MTGERTSAQMTDQEISRISAGSKDANEMLNRVFNRLMNQTVGKMPRWNYYHYGHVLYCWNTEPLSPGPDTKNREWACWRYRRNRAKGTYRQFGNKLFFTTRKKAKARALNWYNKALRNAEKYRSKESRATYVLGEYEKALASLRLLG